MMKKIAVIVLLGFVLVLGGKLYLESKYESKLDQFVRLASSVMTVSYDKVKIGFDGSITLLGLSAQGNSGEGGYSAEEMRLSTSDRLFPLFADKVFGKQQYPDSMRVTITRLSVDSNIFEPADKSKQCRSLLDTVVYSDIGFDKAISDMDVSLELSGDSEVQLDWYIEDQISITEVQTKLKRTALTASPTQLEQLPLSEISISTTFKPEAAEKTIDYCARKLGLSSEAYLTYVGSPGYSVASFGGDLGDDVRDVLIKFVQGGSNLVVSSRPSAQLKRISSIKFFKKRDIVRWLRLSVTSDGKNVVINPFDEPSVEEGEVLASSVVKSTSEDKRADYSELESMPLKRHYQAVPIRQIGQYVDYDIKLKRKGEKSRLKGRLVSVKRGVISVEIRRYGGLMTYTVPAPEVKELLVYK